MISSSPSSSSLSSSAGRENSQRSSSSVVVVVVVTAVYSGNFSKPAHCRSPIPYAGFCFFEKIRFDNLKGSIWFPSTLPFLPLTNNTYGSILGFGFTIIHIIFINYNLLFLSLSLFYLTIKSLFIHITVTAQTECQILQNYLLINFF